VLNAYVTAQQCDNSAVPLGIYISVPFCRSKCSYCNFASGVFSRGAFESYVRRVCADIRNAERTAREAGGAFEREVDSIYLGGGTPTVLEPAQLGEIFAAVRETFEVMQGAEVTVECAPASLSDTMLEALLRCGVNRVSLGVQSFVDQESRAVGRLHTRDATLVDIERLRRAGVTNINIDLIAGLPHQTQASWQYSLEQTIATGAPHVSVYMLEVDEDSRLGRELIAGGKRYHAHFVPDEDTTADLYLIAGEALEAAGVKQYEISNFARVGGESLHNLKYWTRQPYMGFGVDAHSMLLSSDGSRNAVRMGTPDVLEQYTTGAPRSVTPVSHDMAVEEEFFLGLRLRRGIDLARIAAVYGVHCVPQQVVDELESAGLLDREGTWIGLTQRGRLLSNEVFQRFIRDAVVSE